MSKRLQWALLAAFVIVDLVLVAGAVRHVNGTPPSSGVTSAADSVEPDDATATTSPTPDTSAQLPYEFTAFEAVALSTANDGTIVYGTRGRCAAGDDAEVLISTNGGQDFVDAKTGLKTTLAVKTTGASSISVVGADDDCEPRQVTSTDGGRTWEQDDEIELWFPSPDRTRDVVTPAGTAPARGKCIVTALSQVTPESGRVSCTNGIIRGTGDSGAKWVTLGRLDNVRVASFTTPSKGYALARYNGCAANQFSTADGGTTWTPGGCIAGDPAQAISATANGLTAVVAGEVYVSTDGKDWKQP